MNGESEANDGMGCLLLLALLCLFLGIWITKGAGLALVSVGTISVAMFFLAGLFG